MALSNLDYEDFCLEYLVFFVIYVVEQLLHEILHAVINAIATGTIATCGTVGPFLIKQGRIATCITRSEITALNSLIAPLLLSGVGIGLLYRGSTIKTRGLRWGVFGGGLVMWLSEALYSMGWLTPPTFTSSGIRYWGDGVIALETYGWIAQVPGAVLLVIGVIVIHVRYLDRTIRRDMGPVDPGNSG